MAFCFLVPATAAIADDTSAAAREHYKRGTTLYDLQRYEDAAHEYEKAFEIRDDPALLFNIGQAYRLAGLNGKAVAAYKSYLRRVADAPDRAEVQARIVELQRLVDEQKHTQERPPVGTIAPDPHGAATTTTTGAPAVAPATEAPPPEAAPAAGVVARDTPRSDGRRLKIIGASIAGVGVAALAVGITFAVLARQTNDSINHPIAGAIYDGSLVGKQNTQQAVGIAMLSVGGAALVAGASLVAVGFSQRRSHPLAARLVPIAGPNAFGLSLAGSWR